MIGLLGFEIDPTALAANGKYHVDRFSEISISRFCGDLEFVLSFRNSRRDRR